MQRFQEKLVTSSLLPPKIPLAAVCSGAFFSLGIALRRLFQKQPAITPSAAAYNNKSIETPINCRRP